VYPYRAAEWDRADVMGFTPIQTPRKRRKPTAGGCPHYSTDHLPPFGAYVHFGSGIMRHSPCGTIRVGLSGRGGMGYGSGLDDASARGDGATESL
jgi:hypothetical protein